MDSNHCDNQGRVKKLSDEFVEFIDLTNEDVEEIDVLAFGGESNSRSIGPGCSCFCACARNGSPISHETFLAELHHPA